MEALPGVEGDRVRTHTSAAVLARIDRGTRGALAEALESGSPEAIHRRLAELSREWDLDRALMALFAVAGTLALQFGRRSRKRGYFHLLQTQLAFLGLHAVAGWCPPVALFRRLGVRTTREIDAEAAALRGLLREVAVAAP